jgi:hypothetical protein
MEWIQYGRSMNEYERKIKEYGGNMNEYEES